MTPSGSNDIDLLARIARELHAETGAPEKLPALWMLTDPERMTDPVASAQRLPRGAGVVLRHFGRDGVDELAEGLAEATAARGLRLLIAADARRAEKYGAGAHWPARLADRAAHWRNDHPDALMTMAAHDARELEAAMKAGADAAFLSPVFGTRSANARAPLGVEGFSALAAGSSLPMIALGGVNAETAAQLPGSGAAGLAAVDAFA